MDTNWNDSLPIYRQLRDRVVAMILEGVLNDGDPLPSVRSVAAEYRLNPLTVLKGYQQLVDEQLVEKKRGRGMFVTEGARRALLKDERQHFLEEEWPKIAARIQRLGFEPKELLDALDKIPPAPAPSLTAVRDDETVAVYRQLANAGELPLRVNAYLEGSPALARTLAEREVEPDDGDALRRQATAERQAHALAAKHGEGRLRFGRARRAGHEDVDVLHLVARAVHDDAAHLVARPDSE